MVQNKTTNTALHPRLFSAVFLHTLLRVDIGRPIRRYVILAPFSFGAFLPALRRFRSGLLWSLMTRSWLGRRKR